MAMIRKLTKNDVDALQEISVITFTDTFARYNDPVDLKIYLDKAYEKEKLTRELENNESYFYFIFVEEQVAGYLKINVGTAQTEPIAENGLEIERIYISPDFKRQGLGKRLYEKAAMKAKELEKDSIWLGVWEYNDPAQHFYNEMGFTKVGQHSFFVGKDEQIDFIMEKQVG